ncbi:MAG: cytochrome c family protein [Hyphomonas sp.]|uniref:c-type cytochrome n=1 Tax=Hyphomonas sp. TaxID=87 RepID=UPI003003337A
MLKPVAAIAALAMIAACGGSGADESTPPAATATPAAAPAATVTPVPAPVAVAPVEPGVEFASLPAPYNTADYARGKRTFKLCQSCHLTAEGAGNLVGPNLHGLFGREVGSLEGFAYSDALEDADFIWEPHHLDEWLTNPRAYLPGNRMSFAGVRKPEDRLGLIAYLMLETGYTPVSGDAPAGDAPQP